jgi:hypothetical protein
VRTTLLATLLIGAVAAACSDAPDSASSVPLYLGQPNADDAAFKGTLTVDGECLYLRAGDGSQALPAFPASAATWNADTETLTVSGKVARPGNVVTVGGSWAPSWRTALRWKVQPHAACDTTVVWAAGETIVIDP